MKQLLKDNPSICSELIFNLDETPLQIGEKKKIGKKEYWTENQKQNIALSPAILPEKITAIVTTSYNGDFCKTGLIFPTEQKELFEDYLMDSYFAYYHNPSSWINNDIFAKYVAEVFIPKVERH